MSIANTFCTYLDKMQLCERVAKSLRTILMREAAGRAVTVLPDDVFIVSYPKSGNTWLRFLLGNLIWQSETTFQNVNARIPDIYTTDDIKLKHYDRPRILKSHECFDPRYPKVIYMVRDPRSVAVSYYFHLVRTKRLPVAADINDTALDILAGDYDQFGSWAEHTKSWYLLRSDYPTNFLLLRYEDMKENTPAEMSRIADFLDINCSERVKNEALRRSKIKHMKQLERKEKAIKLYSDQQHISFVRSGRTDEWKNALNMEVIKDIDSRLGDAMSMLGYESYEG